MGRNVIPEPTPVVPINGAIYRNSPYNGVIVDATGAQYLPSTVTAVLTSADYPKYVALNSGSDSITGANISPSAARNWGTIVPNGFTYSVPSTVPYYQSTYYYYYPYCGRSQKTRFLGFSATNGTTTVVNQIPPGYKNQPGLDVGCAAFTIATGACVSTPTAFPIITWYDSSTSTFRIVGGTSSSVPFLYTSSDGITWTQTSISAGAPNSNSLQWQNFGDPTYSQVGAAAINQKVFIIAKESHASTNQQCLQVSTNGGSTWTDRSTAVSGTANAYFSTLAFSGGVGGSITMNYDGTTLMISNQSGNWRYSTNDGATFSNVTISGATGNNPTPLGIITAGTNSSSFMCISNTRVATNHVWVTTNGGQSFTSYSWTPAATFDGSYYQCPGDYDASNTRWAFIYGTNAGWYAAVSTNTGATWTHNLIKAGQSDDPYRNMVFLGGTWYAYGNAGIWKSSDAATWTRVYAGSPSLVGYSPFYMELTDYVTIGSVIIKKSDFSTTLFNPNSIYSGSYYKTFVNYLGTDQIIQVQNSLPTFPLFVTSATADQAYNYSPVVYYGQQIASNYPTNVEYWRIK